MKRSEEEMDALLDRMEAMLDDYEAGKDAESRQHWRDSYSDRLGGYEDVLKKMNGDDFDIFDKSYDEYHKDFSDLDEGTYIDRLIVVLEGHIDKLKSALHTDELTIESTEDGTVVETGVDNDEGESATEETINEDVDGANMEMEEESSLTPEEMAELEEVSKNTPRHY